MGFFGVIGNRDYIKLRGDKRPFWEFLDGQPDGWLSSLAYARTDTPQDRPMIWDCGAWSYRTEDVPKLGRHPVTPAWALEQYRRLAHAGDLVIAPDHMLIPGLGDLTTRRTFNRASAENFLTLVQAAPFTPMVAIHGITMDERLRTADYMVGLGYTHLALGGLAGQASRRQLCIDVVSTMRAAFPAVYLHVLGLSSPGFASVWYDIGVNSFDGASHFKQAFMAGAFFSREDGKLMKHNAAKADEVITAPVCDCMACATLRTDGIDTRRYGSNEHNMGRAAHNLNQLMGALEWVRLRKADRQLRLCLV